VVVDRWHTATVDWISHRASDRLLRAPNPRHLWLHPGESDYPVDLELTNGLGSGLLDSSRTSRGDHAL
jgi:hypothetical protein